MPWRKIKWFVCCIISFPVLANNALSDNLDAQRGMFILAEHALKNNDMVNFKRLSQQITSYPLYPYLLYSELKQKIQTQSPTIELLDQINAFADKYADFPFTHLLRNTLLTKAAKEKNWILVVRGYRPTKNEELQCAYHFGQYQLTQDKTHLAQAKPLWLVGHEQTKTCDGLFAAWRQVGGLSKNLIWERIQLALAQKNFKLATYLSKELSNHEKQFVLHWEKLLKDPFLITKETYLNTLTLPEALKTQLLSQGLQNLAKKDADVAMKWWKIEHKKYPFTIEQTHKIKRSLAIALAHQRHPEAAQWLANLPEQAQDSIVQEWRVRVALAHKNWQEALKWINRLPPKLREEKAWLYWQARALEASGQKAKAVPIYEQLIQFRNYYGFLASQRLKRAPMIHHQPFVVENTLLAQLEARPAIQRFLQLILLKRMANARAEWYNTIEKMSDQELAAAAQLAASMQLPELAIYTMGKSHIKDDIVLRFPLGYENDVVANANQHNLDPAWIFAITRQESAFFTDALSRAGARGLMQLLPTTAQMMAKKYDIHYYSDESLYQADKNIQLGTVYLKNLKERMQDNLILATASYNAGPERIKKWLPTQPLEAEIWIENIPYQETREYVKNVLTFTGIYRQRLGHPTALSLMLQPIPPKKD